MLVSKKRFIQIKQCFPPIGLYRSMLAFLAKYKLQYQIEKKVETFKNSLKDNVDEMRISSVVKGLCDTCLHKL